jgi:hypothetical protein
MGSKIKFAGVLAIGLVAGALTTMQLQAVARNALGPLPLVLVRAARPSAQRPRRPVRPPACRARR